MDTATIQEPGLSLAPIHKAGMPLADQPRAGGALAEASPAGIMLKALAAGVSPADLREMLALQREWQADQARASYYMALAAFKAEAITIVKGKTVDFTPRSTGQRVLYKHAELVDVVEAVGPVLSKHGLGFRWDVKQAKDWITVRCILSHRDGHSEAVEMGGPPDNTGNKNQLQQIASTTSYLQRYTLKAITGVAEGGEDDDGRGGAGDQAGTRKPDAGGQGTNTGNARPAYPSADFEKNLGSWRAAIAAGKKTADQVIATVESKGSLTEDQKNRIRAAN